MHDNNREKLSSRLGFLLVSAGCAIGLGNVWRFPYITGKYGGALFVVLYLISLVILGLPILVMEFSVGRAGKRDLAGSYRALQKKGYKWHIVGYIQNLISHPFELAMFILDIVIVVFCIMKMASLIKDTRVWQLIKGIIIPETIFVPNFLLSIFLPSFLCI